MIELKNNPAGNFFLLAGPCVIEGEEMAMRIAEHIVTLTEKLQIPAFLCRQTDLLEGLLTKPVRIREAIR